MIMSVSEGQIKPTEDTNIYTGGFPCLFIQLDVTQTEICVE